MMDYSDVMTKEELEEAKRDEMRERLIEAFDGKSILYEIYQKRGWLDRLFTDRILSMDKDSLYISNQVAEIIETEAHEVKNKRRALIDYVQPEEYGEGHTKTYKHNYISVFKLKMIHGLTGKGSEFTLPQLKELIGQASLSTKTNNNFKENDNEILTSLMRKMERFEQFQEFVEDGRFFQEVEERIESATTKLLNSNNETNNVNKKINEIYDKIISPETSLIEKETYLSELEELRKDHSDHAFTINMFYNAAEDRITRFKQSERELQLKNLKSKVIDYYEAYESANENGKEEIRKQLQKLANENPDLNYDIRYWLNTAGREKKKKGFWNIFGR